MTDWLLGLAVGAAAAGALARLGFLFSRLPAIWRGNWAAMPAVHSRMLDVSPRTYPTFLLCATAHLGFFACIGVQVAVVRLTMVPSAIGLALLLLWPATATLHWQVNMRNRPRFLVPPPLRAERGRLGERRRRRQRQKAGLAPTDHIVEIYRIRPDPRDTEAGDATPFLVAVCTADECDWQEFANDPGDEERSLRRKVARHTSLAPSVPIDRP